MSELAAEFDRLEALEAVSEEILRQDEIHPSGYPATRDGIFLGITTAIYELERGALAAWHRGRCKCLVPMCAHHDWSEVQGELLQAAAVILRTWRSIRAAGLEQEATP